MVTHHLIAHLPNGAQGVAHRWEEADSGWIKIDARKKTARNEPNGMSEVRWCHPPGDIKI